MLIQGSDSLNGLNRKVVSGTDSSDKIANNFNQADLQARYCAVAE
jgi:hypothetical protein